ncbi:Crp/Fnr family transcriptional regulator [Chryseobacterium caseinilyticum]|uniref:Crp/Fnr family transcriptional regulator n=1 Tax=Chryseobacterium caseinilyticum TaxID=2771428 RepID=A0ABR8ZC93_9FLAO|nr:Crp/Fnr family transcriptional regulator [Chryseobacterium caseinilyticum]MBD8082851.1 Crp/Fnr family transcriptional regulator [Chryseobacterium caseinilyticum]
MLIDTQLLLEYGGILQNFDTNEYIFHSDETPKFYYQLISGDIKLNYNDEDGRELIQSLLTNGESVCELLLFIDEKYPVNAVAMSKCEILKLPKDKFMELLSAYPQAKSDVLQYISKTLYQKFIMMQNLASPSAEIRIKGTLKYFKSFSADKSPYSLEIKLTRQQFASISGLRVETVIRCLKKLEKSGFVKIEGGKVYY